jgi:hypothetical protein
MISSPTHAEGRAGKRQVAHFHQAFAGARGHDYLAVQPAGSRSPRGSFAACCTSGAVRVEIEIRDQADAAAPVSRGGIRNDLASDLEWFVQFVPSISLKSMPNSTSFTLFFAASAVMTYLRSLEESSPSRLPGTGFYGKRVGPAPVGGTRRPSRQWVMLEKNSFLTTSSTISTLYTASHIRSLFL